MKALLGLAVIALLALGAMFLIDGAVPVHEGGLGPQDSAQSGAVTDDAIHSRQTHGDQVGGGERKAAEAPPAPQRSAAEVLAELESELARTDTQSPLIDKPLQELAALASLGDTEAAAAFADLLGRKTGIWYWSGALGAAFFMHPFESDAVRSAARLAFEAAPPKEGTDFLSIMCFHGGAAESDYLLGLADDPGELRASSILVQLRRLTNHPPAEAWLERLGDLDQNDGEVLASSLASWHEPAVDAELWRLARAGEALVAQTAIDALAKEARPEDGRLLIDALDQFNGSTAVALMGGIASNQELVRAHARELQTRALATLESTDPELAREAARLIAHNADELITTDVAIHLRALHNEGRLPKDLIAPLIHFERRNSTQ